MRRPFAAVLAAVTLTSLAVAAPTQAAPTQAVPTQAVPTQAAPTQAVSGAVLAKASRPHWQHVDVHSRQQFRGLGVVSAEVAWVGGSAGGVWRTVDGGRHWSKSMPAGTKAVYRDVEASDAMHAQVLAIGVGLGSRIYQTSDGGKTWRASFVNHDKSAFYDCMSMYSDGVHGLALSDPVDGKFRIIATSDGGATWHRVPPKGMPKAPGEFGFAASGTCLVTAGTTAYVASGGAKARIYVSHDLGATWSVTDSTIPPADAGGVFSMAFRSPSIGLAVGGDFTKPTDGKDASAYTTSAGKAWTNHGDLGGYRSGVAWQSVGTAVAVGPSGTDITHDGGLHWTTFSTQDFDAVHCVAGDCWASGPGGVVAHLVD